MDKIYQLESNKECKKKRLSFQDLHFLLLKKRKDWKKGGAKLFTQDLCNMMETKKQGQKNSVNKV